MNNWGGLVDTQPEALRFLTSSSKKGRLVHAYIIEGPKGTGKLSLATCFAKMVLCQRKTEPCGSCRHCQMIDEGNHINVIHIVPSGQNIKKEQIQNLQQEFSKVAAEDAAKVYIIEDADKMSVSASNSLLKFLEEPAKNTYALLLTQNSEKLLPTICSRAIILSLKPMGKPLVAKWYQDEGIGKFASLTAILTQNLEEAKKLSEEPHFNSLVELVGKIEEAFLKTGMDPSVILIRQAAVMKEPNAALTLLKLYMVFYRDVLSLKLGTGQVIGFSFLMDILEESKNMNKVSDCTYKLKMLMNAERRLLSNANYLLVFDQLFLEMKGGNNHGT